ncbi:hypothetical protein AHF37_07719 [Paragonimus kellicotti]|nr:hypothetical protein AHF37_07719 [Paragonimus kellicotti]
MVYADISPDLRSCFKFYKTLKYSSDMQTAIDQSTYSSFHNSAVTSVKNVCAFQNAQACEIFSLFEEGFFLLRHALSEDVLQRLWLTALTDWPSITSKCSNVNAAADCLVAYDSSEFVWDQTLMEKLRWITFGYHYQWDDRCYRESKRGVFPALLADVSTQIANLLSEELTHGSLAKLDLAMNYAEVCDNFVPEASIVNYYRGKTTMGFHTDEVEFDKKAPLVAISLGSAGIFLLETDQPVISHPSFPHIDHLPDMTRIVPLILRHGDVTVMLGKSRLARHAVPAVLVSETLTDTVFVSALKSAARLACTHGAHQKSAAQYLSETDDCILCRPLIDYMRTTRINMNVRQVVPSGCRFSDFV